MSDRKRAPGDAKSKSKDLGLGPLNNRFSALPLPNDLLATSMCRREGLDSSHARSTLSGATADDQSLLNSQGAHHEI